MKKETKKVATKKVETKKEEKKVTKKCDNKIALWFKNNGKNIALLIGGFVLGALLMFILWPDRITKTKDGKDIVATISGKSYTADDLYQSLKETAGLNSMIAKVDLDILVKEYPNKENEAKEYIKGQSEYYYQQYEAYYGMSKEEFLASNNITEEEFNDILNLQYYYDLCYQDYINSLITDKDISKEYKNNVFGDKKVYFFFGEAKKDLEGVTEMLKKGKSLDDIKAKYTNINASEETITYADSVNYSDKILSKLIALKKGKYTNAFKDDAYGYVVVYLVSSEAKPKEADAKETVEKVLVKKLENNDPNLEYKSLINIRKKYDLSFKDTVLNDAYNDYLKEHNK